MSTKLGCNFGKEFGMGSVPNELESSWLQHSFVVEAKEAVAADHHVIENPHAHDVTDFFQAPGDVDVFRARRRVAARMIMDENYRRGRLADHRIVNFARMDQGGRERALRDFHVSNLSV